MTRTFITKKKFYDIRRYVKNTNNRKLASRYFEVVPSTVTRVLQARNFREYKASGQVYGKGVKVLRKRYLFLMAVIVVILLVLNLR